MVAWVCVLDVVPMVVYRLLRLWSKALFFTSACSAGVSGATVAGAAGRATAAGRGFGFALVPVTWTSGSVTCAMAASLKPIKASSAELPSKYARRSERTNMTLRTQCLHDWPNASAVVLSRQIGNEETLPR